MQQEHNWRNWLPSNPICICNMVCHYHCKCTNRSTDWYVMLDLLKLQGGLTAGFPIKTHIPLETLKCPCMHLPGFTQNGFYRYIWCKLTDQLQLNWKYSLLLCSTNLCTCPLCYNVGNNKSTHIFLTKHNVGQFEMNSSCLVVEGII